MKLKFNKKYILIGVSIFVFLIGSFWIYSIASALDTNADKIAIKQATLMSIDTGGSSSSSDGLNYSDSASYTKDTGYTAGGDSKSNNRIVRSFDELKYHFYVSINGKEGNNDYEERKITVKVTIPDAIKKYVSFDPNTVTNESEHTFTYEGIDTYGTFPIDVTLYVLGAKNGTKINPKFEIQESTNTDSNYLVTLGNVAGDTYNYRYDRERNNPYSTQPTEQGFMNYMPTVVSSKTANLRFKVLGQPNEGQKATYNNKVGRYLTYVVGLELVGDNSNGIKGYTMPEGDVSFNLSATQTGNVTTLTTVNDWARLYGNTKLGEIDPVIVALPYSASNIEASKRTRIPGTISLTGTSGKIKDYALPYSPIRVNADGTAVANSEYIIGTYAISVFSERNTADGKNDITARLGISGSATDTANNTLTIPNVTTSLINKYYENVDYSLTGAFYDETGSKISGNLPGSGAVSKGTSLVYKTIFNYKKTLSEQGLKEIIKVDPNAFRVVPRGKEEVKITVTGSDGTKLSQDDFEVKFVSGNWSNSNYNARPAISRLAPEDANVSSSCSANISSYSLDQIMNLYGGPCISAKSEDEYDSIYDAKDGDTEIPITRVIVQTKEGVVLPDVATVTIEVGVRVRNVSDLTQTYQATAVATSSDYDTVLTYYAPRITSDQNSITNPNNYIKTVYEGTHIRTNDTDSPWGDCLKIVNFTSREIVTVTNKNADGTTKINYNTNSGETLTYNIKTIIDDDNEKVGADDVWWINQLKIYVTVPNTLTYVPDKDLGTPEVQPQQDGSTILVYTLPYTKPNQKIPDVNFKATIKPTLLGSARPITVTSRVEAININGEQDTSYFGYLTGSFTIYATGLQNVIVSQKIGDEGSVVEKNSQFSYLLSAYNNTSENINDYSIVDILPSNNRNDSKFSGSYKVKVVMPDSLGDAKVKCSTQSAASMTNDLFSNNNTFEECNITEEFVDATAIEITDIAINHAATMDDIKVIIKPTGNNYEDKYINSFIGGSRTYSKNESNKIEARVISRNISGRIFVDNNEDGKENSGDTYLKDIPVTLYKLDTEDNMTKVEDTVTNENGFYKFKNLDVGRYKIRSSYDTKQYDLTLRYATEDRATDSDAYKIEEGKVEISNYRNPDESDGIKVTREVESVSDMNIGLIPIKSFGFNIDKYITKVDLTYNGATTSKDYPNLKLVKEDVKNSWRASAKVYYGIKIENNSNSAGFVKLINETIPFGSTFDPTDPINAGWVNNNGTLQNVTLQDDIINPGETRYVQIALNIPSQEKQTSYLNTVSIDIERYDPELAEDKNADSKDYTVGEQINYAGVSWHVVAVNGSGDEQLLTLLADSGTITKDNNVSGTFQHTNSTSKIYKWSDSLINKYINSGSFINKTTLNTPILIDANVCDDASGMPIASNGGALLGQAKCQSGIYNVYKVRLLTEAEYNSLSNLTNKSWLYGNGDFWLQNSVFEAHNHDVYGVVTNDKTNLAKYVEKSSTTIKQTNSNASKEVRPVITVSNKNIIPE